jgi:HD superfamily phosphohydrolase
MTSSRADYYDPLYDFVSFEEAAHPRARSFLDPGFAHKGAGTHGECISPLNEAKAILPFLSTREFTRQNFLRQSNLAFLVYPSSTHTRFAHSVGACYLGFLAAQRVGVQRVAENREFATTRVEAPIYLAQFLEESGFREEFYLALLLHDVGHYPFSHALENNMEFWNALGEPIHHEDAACQLILGTGPIHEATRRRTTGLSAAIRREHPTLADLFTKFPSLDHLSICYLISGQTHYLSERTPQQQAQLRVLHELVSGLLDLDRIDHYRRDNYFTGLRTGTAVNFPCLLSGLVVFYDASTPDKAPELRLSSSGIGQAIALLQSKERLNEDCFEHPHNIAYESMLHYAFNLDILGEDCYDKDSCPLLDEKARTRALDLLVSTDEELLFRLRDSPARKVKDTAFRILNQWPFVPAGRVSFPLEHGKTLREIRSTVAELANIRTVELIVRGLYGFGSRKLAKRTGEWLDLHRLRHADGRRLVDGKYRRQIEHFKQAQDATTEHLWFFATTEAKAKRIQSVLGDACSLLSCRREEM